MAITVHYLPEILLEGCDKGREPNDIFKLFFQKSLCWQCQKKCFWNESIPILGYFLSKGTCPYCRQKLVLKSIFLEIGIALLFAISVLVFGISAPLLFVLAASCLLICCFITDYEYGILPDQFTLTLVWVGLIGSLIPIFIPPQSAIIGAVGGYGIFWIFNAIYRCIRGVDGMYPGDFKLNAGIGACVGLNRLLPILAISFLLMIAITLIQLLVLKRKTDTDYLNKEVAYACFASIVAIAAFYLIIEPV